MCAYCGAMLEKSAGHVNRSRKQGLRLFCNKVCAAEGRKKHKTIAQRKAEKAIYDAQYRKNNRELLKAKKRAYHKRTYDPAAAALIRKKRMPQHVEYCRRPKYRAWKRWYDAEYRAKEYGEFAEAYRAVLELNRTIKQRITDYEKRQQNETGNKAQRRGRKERARGRDYSPTFG